jgi:SAM-dependent methyltransferase
MKLQEHLGGHNGKTHIDKGTLEWIKKNYNVKSMIDVGCGPGGMVELANNIGIDAVGIDGDYTLDRYDTSKFIIHDFTSGPAPVSKNYDLAWSVEFVEHVYEKYIPNYVQAMQKAKYLIMTYAPIGHGGYHHVNENTQEYWIDIMSKYNFKYDRRISKEMRKHSTMGEKRKHQFLKQTGLFFINEQR